MIRSHRLGFAALIAVVGLAACGDPNTTTPLANQAKGPKVIQLAGGHSSATGAERSAPMAASADSKIAYMGPTEFVYDGTLPGLDAPAASWYFAPGQQPDPARIAALAKSFGIQGDVRNLPTEQGGGWAVGPEDYSGPVLSVGSDGMLSWWFSPGSVTTAGYACAEPGIAIDPALGDAGATGSGSAVAGTVAADAAVPPNATTTITVGPAPDCQMPPPPAGVPTKDEALAKAKDLFASWGYNVESYQFDDAYADQYSASVNASLTLGGMKAPITLSVGFGENGAITWASGALAEAQQGADYPTVGAAAGLERLKTQQNQYMAMGAPGVMKATTDQGLVQPALGAPDIAPCEPNPASDCAPINNQPVTVTLNSVKPDLTMVWASDNTIWLLPAYTFGSADGGIYTVMAVDDAYIQQADPQVATTEPGGAPAVPVPMTAVPMPVPGSAVIGADPNVNYPNATPAPTP